MTIDNFNGIFTKKQMETIHDNLRAYLANFGYISIEKADYSKGFIFKAYWEIIILCIAFIPLRQYAGGYHAKTRSACLALSALYMIGAVLWIGFAKNHLFFRITC